MRQLSQRGKYLVKDRFASFVLGCLDILSSLYFVKKRSFTLDCAKRVLISNIAHLGDVIIATSAIQYLNQAYPEIEIGFLCSNSSKVILNNHPAIKYLHCFDHWKLNRSKESFLTKLRIHKKTSKRALKEIKELDYDCAIDLYPYFPNSIPLLKSAKIPHRVGYISGGFGPLLTQPYPFKWKAQSMAVYGRDLLLALCTKNLKSPLTYYISKPSFKSIHSTSNSYVVFHVGTPNTKKRWTQERWIELTKLTVKHGLEVVFTGQGGEDLSLISEIIKSTAVGVNLCNLLTVEELKAVIASARGVVSVDTMTAHLSAALQIPTLVFHTGMHEKTHWAPLSLTAEVLTMELPCAPCMNAKGCLKMSCIRDIESEDVFEKMKGW